MNQECRCEKGRCLFIEPPEGYYCQASNETRTDAPVAQIPALDLKNFDSSSYQAKVCDAILVGTTGMGWVDLELTNRLCRYAAEMRYSSETRSKQLSETLATVERLTRERDEIQNALAALHVAILGCSERSVENQPCFCLNAPIGGDHRNYCAKVRSLLASGKEDK